MRGSEPKPFAGGWGWPFVGLAGTVAGILVAFTRIGTEPEWETTLVGVGTGVIVVGAALLVSRVVARSGR